jgi:hypothetical protein
MRMIARYRATDQQGRLHLISEYRDNRAGRWLELPDGTRVTRSGGRTVIAATGESLSINPRAC